MRKQPPTGQDVDLSPMAVLAERKHLVNHRETGTQDA
ncbi:hypothetical protein C7477_1246 [Phyllobacterium leguminum]|uniref:Uncharacterized protein n=1 Tax=Phyllobacterium leguminum TaxID=314237 RepID=A0A318TDR4_9HYPH|nr:hypothetical protein C7477_1246 [Phyllobacterium leguminum]